MLMTGRGEVARGGSGPTFYIEVLKHLHLTFGVRYHLPEFYRRWCRRPSGARFIRFLNAVFPSLPRRDRLSLASLAMALSSPYSPLSSDHGFFSPPVTVRVVIALFDLRARLSQDPSTPWAHPPSLTIQHPHIRSLAS